MMMIIIIIVIRLRPVSSGPSIVSRDGLLPPRKCNLLVLSVLFQISFLRERYANSLHGNIQDGGEEEKNPLRRYFERYF